MPEEERDEIDAKWVMIFTHAGKFSSECLAYLARTLDILPLKERSHLHKSAKRLLDYPRCGGR
jgi:hypothetical protein